MEASRFVYPKLERRPVSKMQFLSIFTIVFFKNNFVNAQTFEENGKEFQRSDQVLEFRRYIWSDCAGNEATN